MIGGFVLFFTDTWATDHEQKYMPTMTAVLTQDEDY
jgi:hypothetical protein